MKPYEIPIILSPGLEGRIYLEQPVVRMLLAGLAMAAVGGSSSRMPTSPGFQQPNFAMEDAMLAIARADALIAVLEKT